MVKQGEVLTNVSGLLMANLVLQEFPSAITDTELFINVLDQFGIAREDALRARALDIVENLPQQESHVRGASRQNCACFALVRLSSSSGSTLACSWCEAGVKVEVSTWHHT